MDFVNELHKSRVLLLKSLTTSEKLNMRSFFDTLIDQLKKDIPKGASPSLEPQSLFTAGEDPDVIAQLIGRTKTIKAYNYKTSIYKKFEKPQATLPPHRLSSSQSVAKEILARLGADLSPRFHPLELKAVFRKLALKHHPDHGGCAQKFQELKASVEELKTVFSS